MKKLLSVFVVVAMLAAFLVPSAFASEEPQIVISSVEALPGDEIKLTVSLVNNPGITNGKITVNYDEAGLEFVKIDVATMDNFTNGIQAMQNGTAMNFVSPVDVDADIELFYIHLKVKDKAAGDYKVGLTINLMKNNAEEDINFEIVEGTVSTPIPDPAQIIVSSVDAAAGEEVKLTVALKNNPGITNGKITVNYDDTGLEFVKIDVATMDNFTNGIQAMQNGTAMNFVSPVDVTADIELFYIYLKVKDDADGDYKVGLTINLMKNNAEDDIVFEIVEGIVTVNHECVLEDVAEVPATCTEPGVKAHQKCACGKLYIDGTEVTEAELVIEALGHTEAEPVRENVVPATCTTAGSYDEVVYCSVCHEELSRETVEVPAGHIPAEPVIENEVPATCTTDGSYDVVVYCSECGKELSRETVKVPAGHNFEDGVCTDCGEKDPDYVPETGDFIYVAVATALVSMMGIVALTKKKEF